MSQVHPGIAAALLCVFAFSCPVTVTAQSATSESADSDHATQPISVQELPDSPGTVWAKSQNPVPQATAPQASRPQSDSPAAKEPASKEDDNKDTDKNDQKLQRPVGTAAAEAPKVSGITAAEPAGAAIAPAKQHRIRTLVIKVGAIIGAGAAIGTVVALSAATPSKPPGAH
jgi:hypothetical protein